MEAIKLVEQEGEDAGRTTREKINNTLTEELFFGICAPIGSLKREVILSLTKVLKETYGYDVIPIKLSNYIEQHKINELEPVPQKTEAYSNLIYKIEEGNEIRREYSNNSILAELAIQDIHISRLKENDVVDPKKLDPTTFKSIRRCYIFDSIKTKRNYFY